MKTLIRKTIAIATALWLALFTLAADNKGNSRMSREQFAELQAKQMASELKLNEAATRQLVSTYCECQKELWAIGPKGHKRHRKEKSTKQNMTEEEARQELTGRFEHWRKFNDIQEKYYKEYSKFLSQLQIVELYDLERKQMDKMRRQGKKRPVQR